MASFKVAATVLCVLLIGRQSSGVLNHGSSKNVNSDEEKKISNSVEDRISNEYGVPAGPGFNGPAPIYGPPELVGNHLQAQIFSPPTQQHGSRPPPSYGPPRNPPQSQFGPRPLKLAPWKLSPPPGRFGITKPAGHGPPIPISLEAYGPPNNLSPPSFSISRPQNGYGPPTSFPAFSQAPQQPPPGVPAPPTPPDIKYDGWQPIAGHVETPNTFAPPEPHHANVNLPSNSYGEPINNPDDHNLKQSVGPSDSDSGLPPPQLPEEEPLHNIQEPAKNFDSLPNTANAQISSSSFSNELTSHINNQDDLPHEQLPPYPSSLPPSPVGDTYGAPPPSSFTANGPYPLSQNLFGSSDFNKHGSHRQQHSFNNFHHQRNQNSFRSHSSPGAFIPPRNRVPHKFRDVVPSGLLNSIHRYRPPGFVPPSGSYGRPGFGFTLKQHPPTSNSAVSFRPGTTGSFAFGNTNSLIAGPNVNYGTPLTFTNFNTPAPVLNYGAQNFGSSTSFETVSSSINGNGRNLYEQQNTGVLSPAYGSPIQTHQQFTGKHECNQQHLVQSPPSPDESQFRQSQINSNEAFSLESGYQVPSISGLELESNSADLQTDMKDSYGNPAGPVYDQRPSSSLSVLSGHSTEAVSALTAQTYAQQASDNLATTNELNIDQLAQLHGNNEPALALAQTLSAEGAAADGFQIQGSKGTYMLQIQSANGPQANENSDGTIRHDQLLSDGLLQDILAAIEEPGSGSAQLVSIQGSPQSQPLQEVFEQKEYQSHQDTSQSASSYTVSETNNDSKAGSIHEDNVALYFNNNGFGESNKEIRSTAKEESVVGEESVKKNDSNSTSQEEAQKAN